MFRNHILSNEFDISETFREKIRAKQKKQDADIEKDKVDEIISNKYKIAKIHNSSEGAYLVSTGDKKYSINHDELVLIIRQSPHLFYDKKSNIFLNLKLIRVIEKMNNGKVWFYYKENEIIDGLETKYDDIEDFFDLVERSRQGDIDKKNFDFIKEKYFKKRVLKYVRKDLFEKDYKNLKMNNQLSLMTVFSASLFYIIPFIPFVGITKYSLTIFPTTTVLILILLYQRIDNKKRLVELR